MPSTYTSPYASSFKSAVRRGTPCGVAVQNIANRCNKSTNVVFNSLFKAGLCFRQKINGQFIYWPCNGQSTTVTNCKNCQTTVWQSFIDWCIMTGFCTPQQLKNNCGSQKDFMNYCKKFWNKQFTTGSTTKTKTNGKRTRTTATNRSRNVSSVSRTGRRGTSSRTITRYHSHTR